MAVSANVTVFEFLDYKGRSVFVTTPVPNTRTILPANFRVESFRVDAGLDLITYSEYNFSGVRTVWHRSTSNPAIWRGSIASFEVVPSNYTLPTPIPGAVISPWKLMGSINGYLLVRMSATSVDHVECFSLDGVNCEECIHPADLMEFLRPTAPENFPATCGPESYQYWGNDSRQFCRTAKSMLAVAPSSMPSWRILRGRDGYIVSTPAGNGWNYCIRPASKWYEQQQCETFVSLTAATEVKERILWLPSEESNKNGDAFLKCYGDFQCYGWLPTADVTGISSKMPGTTSDNAFAGGISGLVCLLFMISLAVYAWNKSRASDRYHANTIEATHCSSSQDDFDTGITFTRADSSG
ncbi:hypothetical protein ACHHYP_06172 [Achlya hypogyna]|uniref:Beta/gamma crystallin 'Greek key' domain-containing protein n=1 Tax=Achlya hypogyna TaxID=1202772 RepID=A0A1V9ZNT6_ACHHY|nr:hypothetical protein ACHHYP_06172 [Achlya hypogyna]